MSAFEIKGWCPGALRPMRSGDGLVVRIRAPKGRLSSPQMAEIAALSQQYGNGILDVSSRANLQMRGVQDAGHVALIEALRVLGLIDETVEIESRRNIVMTPFWQSGDETDRLADAISTTLKSQDYPQTPGKFGIAIDTGSQPVLRNVPADIRIERSEAGLICIADGADHGCLVTLETVGQAIRDLAQWFISDGGVTDGRGRMRTHLNRGATLPDAYQIVPVAKTPSPTPRFGICPQGALIGLPFGQMRAQHLLALSHLGNIRLTPWRMVLLEGACSLPDLPGFLTDPSDPHQHVIACTGAPACPQAQGETRTLAERLTPYLPADTTLHVSGCAKGCALPFAKATTLILRDSEHFDLIRNGSIRDTPDLTNLTFDALLAHPQSSFKRP